MNCTQLLDSKYIPTTAESFAVSGALGIILVSVGGCVAATILGIFLEESIYLYHNWTLKIYFYTIGCLSVFPVTGLSLFLCLLVPRAGRVLSSFIKVYLPFPMIFFFQLVISYMNNKENVIERLSGKNIPLQGPPLCCICCCCPKPSFTRTSFLLIRAAIYQFVLIPVIIFIIDEICIAININAEQEFPLNKLSPYLITTNGLSFFLGVYGLVIFTRMSSSLLCGYFIRSKFITLQLHFILIRFQFFIFDILGNIGTLPCHPPISPTVSALYIKSAILLGEGFILCVLARFFFLHPPPQYRQDQET